MAAAAGPIAAWRAMTTRGATLAALLAVLGRPAWWVLGLAGFLARGGIVLFVLAIVTLPSPLALSNVLAPLLVPIVFGGVTPFLAAAIIAATLTLIAWILVGGWIGAATEVVLIRDGRLAAAEDGLPVRPDGPIPRWLLARVMLAHFVAHAPTAVALAFGSVGIVASTYTELVTPAEVSTPLPLRVVAGAIGPIVAIVVTWVVGEVAGGLAARRIVVGAESIVGSVRRAYRDLVIRPRSTILPALLAIAVLALDLAAMLAAVDLSWTATRARLVELPADPLATGLALTSFAAVWCLALAVAGLIDAWRSAAMTFEAERAAFEAIVEAPGTNGASTHRRPGDWSAGAPGGSL